MAKKLLVSPILKWVGGKRQLLDSIEPLIPQCSTYYEPFIGGGAVLFSRQPDKAVINDSNPELINVYLTLKDEPEALIEKLNRDATRQGFEIKNTPSGIYFLPMINGKTLSEDELIELFEKRNLNKTENNSSDEKND